MCMSMFGFLVTREGAESSGMLGWRGWKQIRMMPNPESHFHSHLVSVTHSSQRLNLTQTHTGRSDGGSGLTEGGRFIYRSSICHLGCSESSQTSCMHLNSALFMCNLSVCTGGPRGGACGEGKQPVNLSDSKKIQELETTNADVGGRRRGRVTI